MSYLKNVNISTSDSASVDSFSRLRTSDPKYVFDSQFIYGLNPLVFEQITQESGASIAHSDPNSCAVLTFASTPTGGKSQLQTFEHFKYQSGRSQLIFMTFNFIEPMADVVKYLGYSDGSDGIRLEQDGSTIQLTILSTSSEATETVTKANWNLDKMDGTGVSGITMDFTKTQILVIDFQWLGVGRVRVGFDIGGVLYYVHEFLHANLTSNVYMRTPNLPLMFGMEASGTVSTTMKAICTSIISEGGEEDFSHEQNIVSSGSVSAASGARTHVLSIRPKATFDGIVNRTNILVGEVDILVLGTSPVKWELCVGDVLTGSTTYSDVNTTYSSVEYNTAGTTSGAPARVILAGYVQASSQSRGAATRKISTKLPITLDAAGAPRPLGTLTLLATGIGASSSIQASISWREMR